MKAIFPNAKLLQPMPNASSVHPNISGNINSTTPAAPNIEPVQNTPNTTQNIPTTTQASDIEKENNWVLYFTIVIIILIIIIVVYKKLRKKD